MAKLKSLSQGSSSLNNPVGSLRGTLSKPDVGTSDGLYQLAVSNGLQKQADDLLKRQQGEDTKKIFSGGFISDIFDVLNSAQYGVVGLIKGKGFLEGVKTRQSFADKDALGDLGLPGVVMGTILDIAVDPLTYIAPYTLAKKIPVIGKAVKGVEAGFFGKKVDVTIKTAEGIQKTYQGLEGGTKTGKYLASKFSWMFGADPVFRETFERSTKNIAVETQAVVDMVKPISKLSPETAAKILTKDKTGRFVRTPLEGLKGVLSGEEFKNVQTAYKKIDDLGQQAVDLGLLKQETYEANIGEYIKNAYTEYETSNAKKIFGSSRVGIKGVKKRVEDLTPEMMAELGQIDNPAYLMFKSMLDLTRDVENAKMLRTVSEKFGTDVAQEGFSQIPSGQKWGELAGKHVPDHMKEYLTEIIEPAKNTLNKKIVANFKFFKVIMNPATHARNVVSNKILNWWKLGMNPLDPRVISSDATAVKEIFKGGGEWTDLARPHGYNVDTFASAELKSLLDSPEANLFGKTTKGWKTIQKKLGDMYQAEENTAKLSAFIFNMKKGLSSEEAWKAAESATFNYAQVTPFVRKLRESMFGMPFVTFTIKSTPVVLETALKNPARISAIGKIKNNIEKLADIEETGRERANEPAWVKNGFYIKLPMKDKQGRSAYFDLTYILPFGDLLAGNIFERNQDLTTGLPEGQATALLKKSPFLQLVSELGKNKDFYGNSIWKNSDPSEKQLKDVMRHLTKTYVPPLIGDQIPGGYNEAGERQQRGVPGAVQASNENQKRNLMEELMRNVGAKVQPMDADIQETYAEWNKRKALQNLLIENGVGSNFQRFYPNKE